MTLSDTEDEEDDFPLHFHEDLGEHAISDDIRGAVVWASVVRFVLGTEGEEYIDPELFTDGDKVLAKAIVFHGPFKTFEEAATSAQGLRAVVVLPAHLWTDTDQPFWVASLSN